jgi:hypothetical protein
VVGVSIHGLEGVPATWTDALATHSVAYRKLSKGEKNMRANKTWILGITVIAAILLCVSLTNSPKEQSS